MLSTSNILTNSWPLNELVNERPTTIKGFFMSACSSPRSPLNRVDCIRATTGLTEAVSNQANRERGVEHGLSYFAEKRQNQMIVTRTTKEKRTW